MTPDNALFSRIAALEATYAGYAERAKEDREALKSGLADLRSEISEVREMVENTNKIMMAVENQFKGMRLGGRILWGFIGTIVAVAAWAAGVFSKFGVMLTSR